MLTFCGLDRIKLLLHILRKLGGYGITADNLEEIVRDAKRDLKDPREVEIIYELLRVRKMEELFERGEVGMSWVLPAIVLQLTHAS